jgi:hypothetical protein
MAARRKQPRRLTPKQKRRAVALKGARTRKVQAERRARVERLKIRVRAARKGRLTRAANARVDALGRRARGLTARSTSEQRQAGISTFDAWETLREMIRDNDKRWLRFYRDMKRVGFSDQAIHDFWFSPPVGWEGSVTF